MVKFPFFRRIRTAHPFANERILALMGNHNSSRAGEEYGTLLHDLIELHDELAESEPDAAQEARQAFLLSLHSHPSVLDEEKFFHFLLDQIRPEDYAGIAWERPAQAVNCCTVMYSFPSHTRERADRIGEHVLTLLRHALQRFEQQGAYEKMFHLLQVAPIPPDLVDPELMRLRNRAHLYEMERVRRGRRLLYAYLALQVLLIAVIFPLLFINAENGALQKQIEQTVQVDMPEEPRIQLFSYADGVYWSIITAASIGYGDITPITSMGKVIAATLGLMGVITIGVIAGLILSWLTPRSLT